MSNAPEQPFADGSRDRGRNHFLNALPQDAWNALASRLEAVELPAHKQLESRGREVDWVYFPESGIASVIAESARGHQVESGIIGREGLTGVGVALGDLHCTQLIVIQIPGAGLRLPATEFHDLIKKHEAIRARALLSARAFMVQASHTALANGAGVLEQRLARWLLMLHDRVESDTLAITHDYIATMLSVRRPGVSVALKELEEQGLMRAKRGSIEIVDRTGLLERAGGLYGQTELEYQRLIGWRTPREPQ